MSGDEEPPPEVHHYEDRGQVPWDIQKYGFSDGFFFLSQSSQLTLFLQLLVPALRPILQV